MPTSKISFFYLDRDRVVARQIPGGKTQIWQQQSKRWVDADVNLETDASPISPERAQELGAKLGDADSSPVRGRYLTADERKGRPSAAAGPWTHAQGRALRKATKETLEELAREKLDREGKE